jgi:hypothetical protein
MMADDIGRSRSSVANKSVPAKSIAAAPFFRPIRDPKVSRAKSRFELSFRVIESSAEVSSSSAAGRSSARRLPVAPPSATPLAHAA